MKMVGELLRQLGNLFYDLNGGLDKVNNGSRLDKITFYFWSKSYGLVDRPPKC